MNRINSLKQNIIDFIEQINDEEELKGFLESLKSDHEWDERERDKDEKYRRLLEKLKGRIGEERFNEVFKLSQEEISSKKFKKFKREGLDEIHIGKFKKWAKKKFPEVTYDEAGKIGWNIWRDMADQEDQDTEGECKEAIPAHDDKNIHKTTVEALKEIGSLKGYEVLGEFRHGNFQYDVIWKRIVGGNPFSVFEVQVGGNLVEALTKLKHAYDIWNSRIYLVSDQQNVNKATNLLGGAFHEIKNHTGLVLWDTVTNILRLYRKLKEIDNLV
jgi:hypothetical protein